MRFTVDELREFTSADPHVRILIVEGRRDVDVWKDLVPINERGSCVVYSIEEIDTNTQQGGNKGAALRLAYITEQWPAADRIAYFLDADNDNVLDVEHRNNVSVTDCRDMEAYALIDQVFERLCRQGASENQRECDLTKVAVRNTIRRVGILRVVSARLEINLPFRAVLADGALSRFLRKRGDVYDLRLQGLIDALGNQGNLSHAAKGATLEALAAEEERLSGLPDHVVVHGKDLGAFTAWYFNVPQNVSLGMIRLAISAEIEVIRNQPRIAEVERWVRAA